MARQLYFQIMDADGNTIIGRSVRFPREIDAIAIDREIALMFIRFEDEVKKEFPEINKLLKESQES